LGITLKSIFSLDNLPLVVDSATRVFGGQRGRQDEAFDTVEILDGNGWHIAELILIVNSATRGADSLWRSERKAGGSF
jgi:hypothetical protein